jgi:predicted esterase
MKKNSFAIRKQGVMILLKLDAVANRGDSMMSGFAWIGRGLTGLGALTISLGLTSAKLSATECLGSAQGAKGYLVYLHGLEPLNAKSNEENENRAALERLAREFSLRIALPRASPCPSKKLCWASKDNSEVLKTYISIKNQMKSCWSGNQPYTMLGFSNGGYYSFKLYKLNRDPFLKRIIASGSSGIWDPNKDKANKLTQFHLMIGDKDITLHDASKFAERFRESVTTFTLFLFSGGHRLDYDTLSKIMKLPPK